MIDTKTEDYITAELTRLKGLDYKYWTEADKDLLISLIPIEHLERPLRDIFPIIKIKVVGGE